MHVLADDVLRSLGWLFTDPSGTYWIRGTLRTLLLIFSIPIMLRFAPGPVRRPMIALLLLAVSRHRSELVASLPPHSPIRTYVETTSVGRAFRLRDVPLFVKRPI